MGIQERVLMRKIKKRERKKLKFVQAKEDDMKNQESVTGIHIHFLNIE